MNEQQLFWAQDYAEEYIRKNSLFNRGLGIEAWQSMLKASKQIDSVLECGCNVGRNLDSLSTVLPSASKSVIEISRPAFDHVTRQYKLAHAFNGSIEQSTFSDQFDLVFTIGVLIHIHPDNLFATTKKIFDYSRNYILIGEYFNRTPVMIEYQGRQNKLFKRDFGKFFIDHFALNLVDYGFLWGHLYDSAGFDDITWWLFRKA